jgi:transcriptional regulator with XRE-family HTH domain
MTSTEFQSQLARLGWSQAEFARRTGVGKSTVNRWSRGHDAVPKWAAAHLKMLLLATEMLAS